MNDREREALDNLVTYVYADERADYYEQDPHGQERHIFREILILSAYLGRHGLIESEDGS